MTQKAPSSLFGKSFGPSRVGSYGRHRFWNLENSGTDGPVTCEICGTHHDENREESYMLFHFLGYLGVEQCCGAIIDEMYQVTAERFAEAYMEKFSENPGDPKFGTWQIILADLLTAANTNARHVAETTDKLELLAIP